MTLQYQIVATKPNGEMVFWKYNGYSKHESNSARLCSIDFADLTCTIERREHPNWNFNIRVSEAA